MPVFVGLAIIMAFAAAGGIVARVLRQPLLLGYAVVGAILAFTGIARDPQIKQLLDFSGQMGVTLLLFLVGLELPISELKNVGKHSLITGTIQILLTFIFGLIAINLLGINTITGSFVALGLAFSSTVVVIKFLTERGDLASLHGKLTVGILLVQDFVAIGVLIFLSGTGNPLLTMVKGAILIFLFTWVLGKLLPKIIPWLAGSSEMLFVWALAWCLSVASIVASPWVGFSPELGGFLAGLALANVSQHLQISTRIRPLRDFFLTLFFVSLGAGVTAIGFNGGWGIALALSGFVLIIKPLIVMTTLLVQGYTGRVAFMTAISLAQVSEFSLLIAALAVRTNQAPPEILAIMGLVGLITMIASNYGIMWSNKIYKFFSKLMPKRENKNMSKSAAGHIVLFGHNRIGGILRPVLLALGKPLVIVDFDPEVISRLKDSNEKLEAIYGDVSDDSIYDDLQLSKSEMIISTVSDCDDNLLLLEYLNKFKTKPLVIIVATSINEASLLYKKGANLVVVPHSMGGEYLANLFEDRGLNRDYIVKRGIAHAKNL